MITFQLILDFLNLLLIETIFVSTLILIISKWIKKKLKIELPLSIIKWILISYSTLLTFNLIISLIIGKNDELLSFVNRATGPYYWIYIIMIFSTILLPHALFIKKLGKNMYFILLITLLVNIGSWFERFVIITTSLHYAYYSESEHINIYNLMPIQSILIGIFWGIILLILGNINNLQLQKKEVLLDD